MFTPEKLLMTVPSSRLYPLHFYLNSCFCLLVLVGLSNVSCLSPGSCLSPTFGFCLLLCFYLLLPIFISHFVFVFFLLFLFPTSCFYIPCFFLSSPSNCFFPPSYFCLLLLIFITPFFFCLPLFVSIFLFLTVFHFFFLSPTSYSCHPWHLRSPSCLLYNLLLSRTHTTTG